MVGRSVGECLIAVKDEKYGGPEVVGVTNGQASGLVMLRHAVSSA